MEISVRQGVIVVVALTTLGFAIGRFLVPAKIVTKTIVQTQTVTVEHDNIKTVVQEVDKPGGEVDKTTTTTNLSVDSTSTATKDVSTKIVDNTKPQWIVGTQLTLGTSIVSPLYGVEIQRRILGPIFVGAFGNTNKNAGLSVSLEF